MSHILVPIFGFSVVWLVDLLGKKKLARTLFYTLRYLFGVNDGNILSLPFAILQERVLLKSSPPAVQYPFIPRLGHHPVLKREAKLEPLPVQKVTRGQIYQTAEDVDPMSLLGLFSCHGTRPRLLAGAVMY